MAKTSSLYVYGRPNGGSDYHSLTEKFAKHEALKSTRTSSLPLVSFWRPERLDERVCEIEKALSIDVSKAQLCFEYATSLPRDAVKFGKGKASMTDLMILLPDKRIACEAKYSEYVKDIEYRPTVESWLKKGNHDNRKKVIDGWRYLMGDHIEDDANLDKIPYQLVHRVASACADSNRTPYVLYHLFYDEDEVTYNQMKKFVDKLVSWIDGMRLFGVRLLVAATKVDPIVDVPANLSELFLRMNEGLFGDMRDTTICYDGIRTHG